MTAWRVASTRTTLVTHALGGGGHLERADTASPATKERGAEYRTYQRHKAVVVGYFERVEHVSQLDRPDGREIAIHDEVARPRGIFRVLGGRYCTFKYRLIVTQVFANIAVFIETGFLSLHVRR